MGIIIKRICFLVGIVSCTIIISWPFILIAGLGAYNQAEYIHKALRLIATAMLVAPVALTIGWSIE